MVGKFQSQKRAPKQMFFNEKMLEIAVTKQERPKKFPAAPFFEYFFSAHTGPEMSVSSIADDAIRTRAISS